MTTVDDNATPSDALCNTAAFVELSESDNSDSAIPDIGTPEAIKKLEDLQNEELGNERLNTSNSDDSGAPHKQFKFPQKQTWWHAPQKLSDADSDAEDDLCNATPNSDSASTKLKSPKAEQMRRASEPVNVKTSSAVPTLGAATLDKKNDADNDAQEENPEPVHKAADLSKSQQASSLVDSVAAGKRLQANIVRVASAAHTSKAKNKNKNKKRRQPSRPQGRAPVAAETNQPQANQPQANPPQANQPQANPPQANQPQANEPQANKPQANQPQANKPKANANKPNSQGLQTDDSEAKTQPEPAAAIAIDALKIEIEKNLLAYSNVEGDATTDTAIATPSSNAAKAAVVTQEESPPSSSPPAQPLSAPAVKTARQIAPNSASTPEHIRGIFKKAHVKPSADINLPTLKNKTVEEPNTKSHGEAQPNDNDARNRPLASSAAANVHVLQSVAVNGNEVTSSAAPQEAQMFLFDAPALPTFKNMHEKNAAVEYTVQNPGVVECPNKTSYCIKFTHEKNTFLIVVACKLNSCLPDAVDIVLT